ncbi:hypothetical protein KIN20_009664 [Parelaphostrongylus tenuis]|uniref:Mos1 transposase HTH domain-containing protein n=1 Tax=Parelaphostrongylus tenuis TaxID=148309 RepID=A0AAD5MPC5_PARTN|nr:hypothetical protein KIN20_009664 [Parelaphostrongylus tenuis]
MLITPPIDKRLLTPRGSGYWCKRQLPKRGASKGICGGEDEGTVRHVTVANWYKRFISGDLSLKDQSRFYRPLNGGRSRSANTFGCGIVIMLS